MTDDKIPVYDLWIDRTSEIGRTTFTLIKDNEPVGKIEVTNSIVLEMFRQIYLNITKNEMIDRC